MYCRWYSNNNWEWNRHEKGIESYEQITGGELQYVDKEKEGQDNDII